jgi:phage gp45-like
MSLAAIKKLIEPLKQRVLLMIGRVLILAVKTDGVLPQLTGELLQGEVNQGLTLMQHFGLASNPLPFSEGIAVFPLGDRSQGYVVATEDRRIRPSLDPGETALYSAEDVAAPGEEPAAGPLHSIRLTSGRAIQAAGASATAIISGELNASALSSTLTLNGIPLTFSSAGGVITISAPVPIVVNTTYNLPEGGGGSRPASQTLAADTLNIEADNLVIKLGGKTFSYTASGMPARIGTDTAGGDTIQEG